MAIPETLYKFRTWGDKFHRKCLKNCEFYASQPSSQNDPLDCKIRFNEDKLDTDAKVEQFFIQHFYNFAPYKSKADFASQLRAFKFMFNSNPAAFFEKYNEHAFKVDDKAQGVFSLSKVWNSKLLWSYYANGHKGFCVALNSNKLINSMQLFMHKDVIYKKKLPQIDPSLDIVKALEIRLFTKTKEWEHEQEYRFFKSWLQSGGFASPIDRTIFLKPEVISNVTLGMYINPLDEKKIAAICKKNKWPLYKTFFAKGRDRLDRKLIR